jgi:environmental stress-induced protein Ves
MRWRNGAGVTREVATGPGWRVAIADLAVSGPFSEFPGIDRVLYLLDGPPVTLTVDGVATAMAPLDAVAFPGEATTSVLVAHGPTRDLNVMVERGVVAVTHVVHEIEASLDVAGESVVYVAAGTTRALDAVVETGDSIRVAAGETLRLDGPSSVVVLSFHR